MRSYLARTITTVSFFCAKKLIIIRHNSAICSGFSTFISVIVSPLRVVYGSPIAFSFLVKRAKFWVKCFLKVSKIKWNRQLRPLKATFNASNQSDINTGFGVVYIPSHICAWRFNFNTQNSTLYILKRTSIF